MSPLLADEALELPRVTWESPVRMDLRSCSGARQMGTRKAQHEVIRGVLGALRDARVKTGSDVVVVEGGPALLAAVSRREDEEPGR
jgi:small conductance mechanosensitive channel